MRWPIGPAVERARVLSQQLRITPPSDHWDDSVSLYLLQSRKEMTHDKPLVFLDVSIDGDPAEKMIFELFYDVVPKTAENFRALCTGEHEIGPITGKPLHYKGSIFHRIVKGSMAQAGDFSNRDGSGGESIYGRKFEDESFSLKHDGPGYLSMWNTGPNRNGSQFFITFKEAHHLDGLHVVFGKLVRGRKTLKKIENAGSEKGEPAYLVKIVKCGELFEGKKKANKLKSKDASSDVDIHEGKKKGKTKKSSRERRKKKRRRYSTSESDSSSDSDTESSESDSDSDNYSSSSSDISSSSDDRRKKRKRSHKRDKYKRSKRRRDKRREKRQKRRDKRSRHKSKRTLESPSDTETESSSETSSEDDPLPPARKSKNSSHTSGEKQSPSLMEKDAATLLLKKEVATEVVEHQGESPRENGNVRSNGVDSETRSNRTAERQPDLVDLPGKSRSRSMSPKRAMGKSMSISPRTNLIKSPNVKCKRSMSRSPAPRSLGRSPERVPQQSRSISRSPERKSISSRSRSRSLVRSASRSQSPVSVRDKPQRSISRSSARPLRSLSQSPARSPSRRSGSQSLLRFSRERTISLSPLIVVRSISPERSISSSPVKRTSRRSLSSPVKRTSRRSLSRSPGRGRSRKSMTRSPIRPPSRSHRHSYSRSPGRKGRSPLPSRGRSTSRSVSPDGSPKRIRRGRGFSQRYSYARRYRTPSPDRSPFRLHRYSGRSDRDRYSSYRSYNDHSSRHYRSPIRGRTPPRYRSRRSRTRSHSLSRSPIRYRRRGKRAYSPSPDRSRSPVKTRSRGSLKSEKRRSISSSRSRSKSRSPSITRSSSDSPYPKLTRKDNSRSVSGSPPGKGLVSYGDGSPDSGQR
ncbi:Peptidyl-prolyl cis-trans isomerase [Thalictrum thalictroides]|uniref:peptidylprolyl isomerase n=1 Tax=Thalictrum thalictroides TaxID=46969 RepID=A0A7J6WGP9_THATH|nr:Peptidyl-prolyl cis-trans isomerase [Thalictrum thalictroides]